MTEKQICLGTYIINIPEELFQDSSVNVNLTEMAMTVPGNEVSPITENTSIFIDLQEALPCDMETIDDAFTVIYTTARENEQISANCMSAVSDECGTSENVDTIADPDNTCIPGNSMKSSTSTMEGKHEYGNVGVEANDADHSCKTHSDLCELDHVAEEQFKKSENSNITLEQAKKGLLMGIIYLEARPEIACDYVKVLWSIMMHIVKHSMLDERQCHSNVDDESFGECDPGDDDTMDSVHITEPHSMPVFDNIENIQDEDASIENIQDEDASIEDASDVVVNKSLTNDKIECESSINEHTIGNVKVEPQEQSQDAAESSASKCKGFTCLACGKSYSSTKCFQNHMFVCPSFIKANVKDDLMISKSNKFTRCTTRLSQKPVCAVCHKQYKDVEHLNQHMIVHSRLRPYECKICDKSYTDRSSLRKHKRIHTGERPFQCTTCGKCFIQSNSLKAHLMTHSGERPYECQTCQKRFRQPSALTAHMKVHSGEKPHVCPECGKCFTQLAHVKSHLVVHTGEKNYQCETCSKWLGSSKALKMHRTVHTGEKPFKCSICDKSFSTSSGLVAHTRIHTGERPYLCSICGKAFTQSDKVVRHMRVHTGERPFACKICDQKFSDSSILRRHMRIHNK